MSSAERPPVSPRQMDAIREVVNIGAGHAATNLSTMTGLRVMISVPRVQFARGAERVAHAAGEEPLVAVSLTIDGISRSGGERASLLLSRDTALRMVALMMRRDASLHTEIGDLERSALMEMGNIVCAAYVGVLGDFLRKGVMIGTPEFLDADQVEEVTQLRDGLMIETDFTFVDTTFEGVFVLSHSDVSFDSLLGALGLAEE